MSDSASQGQGDSLVPSDIAELRLLVEEAMAAGRAVEVVGGGTKHWLGHAVDAAARLSTRQLAGVDLYEPEELVMSAGAGTPLMQVEAMLAERGQQLAFEPPDFSWLGGTDPALPTIGAVFACNLAGPRRPQVGAARDHLLGVQCVTGRGEIIKAGGRVVKNVTGYDLPKLLCGSHGTLAVLSRVTFKVLPRAEAEGTLLLRGFDEPLLLERLRRAQRSAHEVSGAAMLTPLAAGRSSLDAVRLPGRAAACLRVEGPAPSVRYRLAALARELAHDGLRAEQLDTTASRVLWAEIRDLKLISRDRALWRLSMPPAAAGELQAWLAELSKERLYDWGGGLVWVALKPNWAAAADIIRQAFAGRGGHATLWRGDADLRASVPVFEPQPPALAALTRRVKESFDPQGILNPGRMYPKPLDLMAS